MNWFRSNPEVNGNFDLYMMCDLLGAYPLVPIVCRYCMQEKQKYRDTEDCISKMNITGKELDKINSCYRRKPG